MIDAKFFTHPRADWQRRYEALRTSFVDRLPAKVVADRFGFTPAYINLMRHLFKTGKLDFNEPTVEGKIARRKVSRAIREKVCAWRRENLSAGEIAQLLF
ncbi:MAG: transposase, partial [Planctomycetota bacterium]